MTWILSYFYVQTGLRISIGWNIIIMHFLPDQHFLSTLNTAERGLMQAAKGAAAAAAVAGAIE